MCILGDQRLGEETSKAFKKDKKLVKGIAFPTCISVNNCICHYSPLTTEPDQELADGDMVCSCSSCSPTCSPSCYPSCTPSCSPSYSPSCSPSC